MERKLRMSSYRWIAKYLLVVVASLGLVGCGINNIPTYDENAEAKWRQVENQYKRRADLIPNLVNTVKGYAKHEREVLNEVVEARSRATSMTLPADISTNAEALKLFQENQQTLSSALSRLLVTVERYPDLKASENFRTLQSQLEGTENRIAVARRDFIEAVRAYNTELRTYPGKWWKTYLYPDAEPRESLTIEEADRAKPQVSFD